MFLRRIKIDGFGLQTGFDAGAGFFPLALRRVIFKDAARRRPIPASKPLTDTVDKFVGKARWKVDLTRFSAGSHGLP